MPKAIKRTRNAQRLNSVARSVKRNVKRSAAKLTVKAVKLKNAVAKKDKKEATPKKCNITPIGRGSSCGKEDSRSDECNVIISIADSRILIL